MEKGDWLAERRKENKKYNWFSGHFTVRKVALVVVFAAISNILYLWSFPIFPGVFMNFNTAIIFIAMVTNAPLVGILVGSLGSLYTMVIYGHPIAIFGQAVMGLVCGLLGYNLFLVRWKGGAWISSFASGLIFSVVTTPLYYYVMGFPWTVCWAIIYATAIKTIICATIAEIILLAPRIKKELMS